LISLDFISYRLGHSIQSDVLFGNNLGDISTYCNSKYFILNEQAHPGAPINCIKVTNVLTYDIKGVTIVTGGEDGIIKIWDASL
jgi:WD40 repeat protein